MFLLRFDLNAYTDFWNSPRAAVFFWCALTVLLVAIGLLIWRIGHRVR